MLNVDVDDDVVDDDDDVGIACRESRPERWLLSSRPEFYYIYFFN